MGENRTQLTALVCESKSASNRGQFSSASNSSFRSGKVFQILTFESVSVKTTYFAQQNDKRLTNNRRNTPTQKGLPALRKAVQTKNQKDYYRSKKIKRPKHDQHKMFQSSAQTEDKFFNHNAHHKNVIEHQNSNLSIRRDAKRQPNDANKNKNNR